MNTLPVPVASQPLTLAAPPQPQAVTVVEVPPPPAPLRKLRRNGLIARLPKDCRDMVNRMISNGAPYKQIVGAVDECGFTVSERNLSNWAAGGHLDWLNEQADLTHHRHIQDALLDHVRRDEPSELPEVGLQAAATRISELLVHKSVTGADIESALPQYQHLVDMLCRLNREISALQEHREERNKYLGRTRELLKVKEQDERQLQAIEDCYSRPTETTPQLPASPEPRALPPAPAPAAHAPSASPRAVPPTEPAIPNGPDIR